MGTWNARRIIDLLLLVVTLSGALVLTRGAAGVLTRAEAKPRSPEIPAAPLSLDGAVVKGSSEAPVVVLEFSSFTCVPCRGFVETVQQELDRRYVAHGRVAWAFRHLSLIRRDPLSLRASVMVACAGRFGRFWEAREWAFGIFGKDVPIDGPQIERALNVFGVTPAALSTCESGPELRQVTADLARATALGVRAAPTFFIGVQNSNRELVVRDAIRGSAPTERFTRIIDTLLAGR